MPPERRLLIAFCATQGSVSDVFKVAVNFANLTTLQLSGNTGLLGPLLPANTEPITTAVCALGTVSLWHSLDLLVQMLAELRG